MAGGHAAITPALELRSAERQAAALREPAWVRRSLIAITILFLSLFILVPVANIFYQAFGKGLAGYIHAFRAPAPPALHDVTPAAMDEWRKLANEHTQADKTQSAILLTLEIAAIAVPLNLIFGIAASWAIAKHRFKGRALLVSLIDLPFSVSPVVAGLIFVLLFGMQGFLEHWGNTWSWPHPGFWQWLAPSGWHVPNPASLYWRGFGGHAWPLGASEYWNGIIFTPPAAVIATIFVTFPFVARNLIPLMEAQGTEAELAAITLGAGGWQTFRRVTLPNIKWGLLYGVILCNARAMGEFGAVSVVSGSRDYNNTLPLRIQQLWDEPGNGVNVCFAVASVLTVLAVITLILKTLLEWKTRGEN
jgi:sulfate transport system permease protein